MLVALARRVVRLPCIVLRSVCTQLPAFRFIKETQGTQTPISFEAWFIQHILGINIGPYWPVDPTSRVVGWKNILAGVETSPGLMGGCYIQAIGKIYIGDYTQIAPNVGIISANHTLTDNRQHEPTEIKIGKYCWIGMGATILPGTEIGNHTVVGAGAVVSRSFPDGYCVIAGNPAKVIKRLPPDKCIEHHSQFEYHGYVRKEDFEDFRRQHLNV